jgi:K+-sensing histidine kinase KdpD
VGAALALAQLLQYFIPGLFVFPFLAAVLVSAWLRTRGAAVLAMLLSTLAAAYFFLPPVHSLAIEPWQSSVPAFHCFSLL